MAAVRRLGTKLFSGTRNIEQSTDLSTEADNNDLSKIEANEPVPSPSKRALKKARSMNVVNLFSSTPRKLRRSSSHAKLNEPPSLGSADPDFETPKKARAQWGQALSTRSWSSRRPATFTGRGSNKVTDRSQGSPSSPVPVKKRSSTVDASSILNIDIPDPSLAEPTLDAVLRLTLINGSPPDVPRLVSPTLLWPDPSLALEAPQHRSDKHRIMDASFEMINMADCHESTYLEDPPRSNVGEPTITEDPPRSDADDPTITEDPPRSDADDPTTAEDSPRSHVGDPTTADDPPRSDIGEPTTTTEDLLNLDLGNQANKEIVLSPLLQVLAIAAWEDRTSDTFFSGYAGGDLEPCLTRWLKSKFADERLQRERLRKADEVRRDEERRLRELKEDADFVENFKKGPPYYNVSGEEISVDELVAEKESCRYEEYCEDSNFVNKLRKGPPYYDPWGRQTSLEGLIAERDRECRYYEFYVNADFPDQLRYGPPYYNNTFYDDQYFGEGPEISLEDLVAERDRERHYFERPEHSDFVLRLKEGPPYYDAWGQEISLEDLIANDDQGYQYFDLWQSQSDDSEAIEDKDIPVDPGLRPVYDNDDRRTLPSYMHTDKPQMDRPVVPESSKSLVADSESQHGVSSNSRSSDNSQAGDSHPPSYDDSRKDVLVDTDSCPEEPTSSHADRAEVIEEMPSPKANNLPSMSMLRTGRDNSYDAGLHAAGLTPRWAGRPMFVNENFLLGSSRSSSQEATFKHPALDDVASPKVGEFIQGLSCHPSEPLGSADCLGDSIVEEQIGKVSFKNGGILPYVTKGGTISASPNFLSILTFLINA